MKMRRSYLGSLLIVISAFCFGFLPIFGLYAYEGGVNIPTLLFIRFGAASAVLFILAIARGELKSLNGRNLAVFFLMGAILYAAQATCYFSALKWIPASLTSLLLYTNPILVALLSLAFHRERPAARVMLAIPICFLGLVLVLGLARMGTVNVTGVAMALGAAVIYSIYIVIGNRLVHQVSSLVTSAFVTLFACLSFLIYGLSTSSLSFHFTAASWFPLAGIALVSTVVSVLTFFKGLELVGSTTASVLSMLEPVVTIVLSFALLGERLTGWQGVGAAIVLGGALLVILGSARKHGRNENNPSLEG